MPARRELKEWTVMFYLATDNPLAPGVVSHLKAMKSAGYHPQVNVLAQFDPHGGNMPTHIFDVNHTEKLIFPNRVNIGFAAITASKDLGMSPQVFCFGAGQWIM